MMTTITSVDSVSQKNIPRLFAPEIFPDSLSGTVCGFSKDGRLLYFTREEKIKGKTFLYQAEKKAKRWKNLSLLPFSGMHNDVGGRLSNDGNTFYFTSDRPGGSSRPGDSWNLWQVRQHNGVWEVPAPLSLINEKGDECCPVPVGNGKLFFSADRGKLSQWWIISWDSLNRNESFVDGLNQQKTWQWPSWIVEGDFLLLNSMGRNNSYGMDDIYIAFDSNGHWTQPINLGRKVNSKGYEDGAVLSPGKKNLIFCRHATPETPSRVFFMKWASLLRESRKKSLSGRTQ